MTFNSGISKPRKDSEKYSCTHPPKKYIKKGQKWNYTLGRLGNCPLQLIICIITPKLKCTRKTPLN